jgi:hypothetical protein
MSRFKKVTHVLAAIGLGIVGFIVSPAGQALIKQYPIVSGVAAGVAALAAVYHVPIPQ